MERIIELDERKTSVCTISDYNNSPGNDCRLVILTSRDVTIIRSFLYPAALWNTRFGSWVGRNTFIAADSNDFADYLNTIYALEYKLSGGCMSDCFQTIGDGLKAIASAIANKKCCGQPGTPGGGGTGGTGGTPSDGGNDIGSGYPDGYDTKEQYLIAKCNYLNFYLDQIRADLERIRTVSYVGMTPPAILSVLVGLILSPIAGSDLFGLAVYLAGIGDSLANVLVAFDAARNEMLCALYLATSPVEGRNGAMSAYYDQVDALTAGDDYKSWAKKILGAMLTYDGVNVAFEYMDRDYPDGECICAASCDDMEGTFELTSREYPEGSGWQMCFISSNEQLGIDGPCLWHFDSATWSGYTDPGGSTNDVDYQTEGDILRGYNGPETLNSSYWVGDWEILQWRSSTPFTMTVTISRP